MARILVGAYMVRYPLGGMLSMSLQIVVGLRRLGHDVMVIERSGWPESCFDPSAGVMTDNCTYGTSVLARLLARFGLEEHWCYVDQRGRVHGCPAARLRDALANADAFVDAGTHGLWLDELGADVVRVLLDGEPGWTQMRWSARLAGGDPLPRYDVHFTVGQNVGTALSSIPTIGREWRHTFYPVLLEEFAPLPADESAPYTSVMNWQSHEALVHEGASYGQKDVEFERFVGLPARVRGARFELAMAGERVPRERLRNAGWHLRDAHAVTASYDGYREFVRRSRAEFSVAKHVFVATRSGWLGDRNAAYLAAGRPVVLQDTGISEHLPCGEGLFAVGNPDEAAAAVEAIEGNYGRHSAAARELAREFLATDRVLPVLLAEAGL
jgi:hypothetical protein